MNPELLAYIQGVFSGVIAVGVFWVGSINNRNNQ